MDTENNINNPQQLHFLKWFIIFMESDAYSFKTLRKINRLKGGVGLVKTELHSMIQRIITDEGYSNKDRHILNILRMLFEDTYKEYYK